MPAATPQLFSPGADENQDLPVYHGMRHEIPMARLEDLGCVHAEHKLAISIEAHSRHSADGFAPHVQHAKLC